MANAARWTDGPSGDMDGNVARHVAAPPKYRRFMTPASLTELEGRESLAGWGPPRTSPRAATVSVVIPTLNEAKNLGWVLERLPAGLHEVILVDGRSTDGTVEIARRIRPDIRVVLEQRPGKGVALRAGFDAAQGDYIIMIDADGSMDPCEIHLFVEALAGGCDFVKGSRFAHGGGTTDMSLIRRVGNGTLMGAVNLLYRTDFSDLCYGYIGFRRDKLDALRLAADGFEIETEMIVRAVLAGLSIGEVPSFEAERQHGESNLNARRDGIRVLKTLLRKRFLLPQTPVVTLRVSE